MSDATTSIPAALGNYPVLQFMIGAGALVGAFIVWVGGERKKNSIAPQGTQLYLDGPIVRALDLLQGIYRTMQEMREDNKETVQEFRERHERELELLRGGPPIPARAPPRRRRRRARR